MILKFKLTIQYLGRLFEKIPYRDVPTASKGTNLFLLVEEAFFCLDCSAGV